LALNLSGHQEPTLEVRELLDLVLENHFSPKAQSALNYFFSYFTTLYICYVRWAPGQPDDTQEKQNCLAVDFLNSDYAFKDENCDTLMRYICVAEDTSSSTTGARKSQSECAANFGIDESEPKNLKSLSLLN
jgi:hypothetical protein